MFSGLLNTAFSGSLLFVPCLVLPMNGNTRFVVVSRTRCPDKLPPSRAWCSGSRRYRFPLRAHMLQEEVASPRASRAPREKKNRHIGEGRQKVPAANDCLVISVLRCVCHKWAGSSIVGPSTLQTTSAFSRGDHFSSLSGSISDYCS